MVVSLCNCIYSSIGPPRLATGNGFPSIFLAEFKKKFYSLITIIIFLSYLVNLSSTYGDAVVSVGYLSGIAT